jgi:hypothetical protein
VDGEETMYRFFLNGSEAALQRARKLCDRYTSIDDNDAKDTDIAGLYPQASARLLTHDDLVSMSKRELKIMRNEIFARHGYIFKTTETQKYFNSQPWYQPKYHDVSHLLTPIEQKNIKLIKQYEK